MLAITVVGPRCLLEASKNLPKVSQEPPKRGPRALKRHPRAFKKSPRSLQEGFEREGCLMSMPLDLELPAPGANCCLLVCVAGSVVWESDHDVI